MSERSADVGCWLRAVRRARSLSQRELAERAEVSLSTISGIEGGKRSPTIALLQQVLAAADCRLDVIDVGTGAPVAVDDEHDAVRDRGGRRLPAHLRWRGRPTADNDPWWWGWDHIAWSDDDNPLIPDHTWRQRPRAPRGPRREHPWFGQFRGREACFGPASEPCENCLGDCRYAG